MKCEFRNRQSKEDLTTGPYKSIQLNYERLIADNEEIAIFDKNHSGLWQLVTDNSRWTSISIKEDQ